VTPEQLSLAISKALSELVAAGRIPSDAIPKEIVVERPKNREHGDWATNVAMQIAPKASTPPREIAELLIPKLQSLDGVTSAEIAGPGFINLFVSSAAAGVLARQIVESGSQYGKSSAMSGEKLNLEFVSANPTGPVHLGCQILSCFGKERSHS